MRAFQNSCTFEYSWNQVSIANWRKYCAWNTQSTHVIAVDTLSRHVDPSTGIVCLRPLPHSPNDNSKRLTAKRQLHSERLITCRQSAPRWLLKLTGVPDVSHVRELSEVDPATETVTMRSENLTGSHIVRVQETVIYSPHPDAPRARTLFTQGACITAYGGFSRVCAKVEEWSVERFVQNAQRGRMGLEAVLEMSARAFRPQQTDDA